MARLGVRLQVVILHPKPAHENVMKCERMQNEVPTPQAAIIAHEATIVGHGKIDLQLHATLVAVFLIAENPVPQLRP